MWDRGIAWEADAAVRGRPPDPLEGSVAETRKPRAREEDQHAEEGDRRRQVEERPELEVCAVATGECVDHDGLEHVVRERHPADPADRGETLERRRTRR